MERLPAGHCLSEAEPGPWSTDSKPRALVLTPGFLSRAGETHSQLEPQLKFPVISKEINGRAGFMCRQEKGRQEQAAQIIHNLPADLYKPLGPTLHPHL